MSFTVRKPEAAETPLLVEVPHAGLAVDALVLACLDAPARAIGMDADLYVDELYRDAPALGATLLIAHASRYVVDLNRAEEDIDGDAVEGAAGGGHPHGLIWRRTTEGRAALRRPIPRGEYERRLDTYYRPYHAALRRLLEAKRDRFGYAILLAAHSMPSSGRPGHSDPGDQRASVVPGSRGRTTAAAECIDCPDRLARARGWSVAHDQAYRGGFTTGHYGRPHEHLHAVQVELNRNLYMDEQTLQPRPGGFEATRNYCRELVAGLAALDPRSAHRSR